MKQWKKSSEPLKALFAAALPDDVAVERRQMFGYPCAFVRGNMVTGLHEENLMVRLGDVDREELLSTPGAKQFEPMPGRAMREYVVVPAAWHADPATLRAWIARAIAYAKSLPAKGAKPAKSAAPKVAPKKAAKASAKKRSAAKEPVAKERSAAKEPVAKKRSAAKKSVAKKPAAKRPAK